VSVIAPEDLVMSITSPDVFDRYPDNVVPPEFADTGPSYEQLVTEADAPMENLFAEKQMRLLTRPLYSSWAGRDGDYKFVVATNVAVFYWELMPPMVPNVLLAVGVKVESIDLREKCNHSYFVWEVGSPPSAVVEIVSNPHGRELGEKKDLYARMGVPVYAVWDPYQVLSSTPLQCFGRDGGRYVPCSPMEPDLISFLGLGLRVWHGTFEQVEADWLRWCDHEGNVIPLGEERAALAEQRIARLEAQLRGQGIEPATSEP
jgi:hypothetical protein